MGFFSNHPIQGQRGDYVLLWYDTEACGAKPLIGLITEAGQVAVKVLWESGLSNRVRREDPHGVQDLERRAVGDQGVLDHWAFERLHG